VNEKPPAATLDTSAIHPVYSGAVSTSFALLGLLEPAPRHGYDLKRLFDRYFAPDRPLAFGQVYATLGRLERDGQVVVASVGQAEGPERKTYAITNDGSASLDDWLTQPIDPEPHLQALLFTKVTLAVLTGRPVTALLDAQRHRHLARMRELTTLRRSAALPVVLLADFALFHLEADLRWIELTAARADELASQIPPLPVDSPTVASQGDNA
jgi:DNA-binding PadR family transcriptional regulator